MRIPLILYATRAVMLSTLFDKAIMIVYQKWCNAVSPSSSILSELSLDIVQAAGYGNEKSRKGCA